MAARYWVGGTDTWDTTAGTKWALTDGGTGGQAVPTAGDTVFFTALSGAVTVTWAAGASTTIVSISCTGFTGTLATGGNSKTLTGNGTVWTSPVTCTITGAPGMTVNYFGAIGVSVTCNHAAPSVADSVTFAFVPVGGSSTYVLTLSGTGFKGLNFLGPQALANVNGTISVYGDVVLSSTSTFTGLALTFKATASFTSAGKTVANTVIDAPGGTVTVSSLTVGTSNTLQLTQGTLNISGTTVNAGFFTSSNSNTRSITFGTGSIALTATTTSAQVLNMQSLTGFSFTGTGGFTRSMSSTATMSVGNTAGGSSTTAPNVTVSGANALTITTGSHFKTLTFPSGGATASGSCTLYGNLTLANGGTYTALVPTFAGTATITNNGRVLGSTTVNGAGITVTLSAALSVGVNNSFTLTQGTLNLAGFTLSAGSFISSNSNTRSITFGAGNIALTSTTAAFSVLQMATATNFTYTATGGGFTRNQAATATVVFGTVGGSGINAPNLTVNAGASTLTITNNSWFGNVNFTGSTCTVSGSPFFTGNLTLASGGIYTALNPYFSNTATATVVSAGRAVGNTTVNSTTATVVLSDGLSTLEFSLLSGTLNLSNNTLIATTFTSNNTTLRSIAFGSGNINLVSGTNGSTVLGMANATNFSWTGTGGFIRNQTATATVQFGSSIGSADATNAPNLTVNAGASALTITNNSWFRDVDFTGSTSTVSGNYNASRDLTLGSGGLYLALSPTFVGFNTLTSNGKTLGNVTINITSGATRTLTLADPLTVGATSVLTLTEGTFTAANYSVSTGYFNSSNTNTRTLNMGSGGWFLTGSTGTTWNTGTTTGLTLNPSTSEIIMNSGSTTFSGGGLTYYRLYFDSSGTMTVLGSNTFNTLLNANFISSMVISFAAGTTQTVTNFGITGGVGFPVTINSATPGSQFTLSKSSGTVDVFYLSIKDSNATGGAVWDALISNGNQDLGNNTGWEFGAVSGGNMFFMFS